MNNDGKITHFEKFMFDQTLSELLAGMPVKNKLMNHKNVSKVLDNISKCVNKEFSSELRSAMKEYTHEEGKLYGFRFIKNTVITEHEETFTEFSIWFVLERALKNMEKTPAKYYADLGSTRAWEAEIIKNLMKFRRSFFEIIHQDGKDYRLRDIMHEDEYDIVTVDMPVIENGIIGARIAPKDAGTFFFCGAVMPLFEKSEEMKNIVASEIKKLREANDRICIDFIKCFGCHDPEFASEDEAIQAIKTFNRWCKNKEQEPFQSNKDAVGERFGLVFTEGGINLVDYYGFIKDLFSGKHKSIPRPDELFEAVIEKCQYISDSSLRMLVENNKEHLIEVMKEFYDDVETYEDAIKVIKSYRPYFHSKEYPRIEMHDGEKHGKPDQQEQIKKIGRNDPCPCGSGKKYKKCCLR